MKLFEGEEKESAKGVGIACVYRVEWRGRQRRIVEDSDVNEGWKINKKKNSLIKKFIKIK